MTSATSVVNQGILPVNAELEEVKEEVEEADMGTTVMEVVTARVDSAEAAADVAVVLVVLVAEGVVEVLENPCSFF